MPEGGFHGGDGTTPPLVAFFTADFVGCLMTQARASGDCLKTPINDLNVMNTHALRSFPTEVGLNVYESNDFNLDIPLDSLIEIEDRISLIQTASRGCLIDQSQSDAFPVIHRLKTPDG